MLAAIYRSPGGSEVLRIEDVPTPEPGPGEVRVRIALSGVNPTDWKNLRRLPPAGGGPFAVPHQDGAGTIDAVGPGVDPSRVGQRVWVLLAAHNNRWGTAAQYSVVPAERAVELPEGASFELGASLGVPALTASYCLCADGPITGKTVLVSGGAGAVGNAAIQMAKFEGAACVISTISGPEKAELARTAGADRIVNYRDDYATQRLREAAPYGVDHFVEVALDQNLDLDLDVAAPHATIVSYAATDEAIARVPVRQLMMPNLTLKFMLLYTVTPAQLEQAIERVSAAVAAGALRTLPLHRFPLERIGAAQEAVESGVLGKVLVEIP